MRDPIYGNEVQLSPEQAQAADPDWAAANPASAALERYYNPLYGPQQSTYHAGANLRNALVRPNSLGAVLNRGAGPGALAGAGIGGAAGVGLGLLTGEPMKKGLLAALLGAGLGGYIGGQRAKSAGWRSSVAGGDASAQLSQAIGSLPGISFSQKAQFMAAVPRMSAQQQQELMGLISQVGWGAAGALIARYMMGTGLIGTAVGGYLGAMFGRPASPRNAAGLSMGNSDFFGNSIF